MPVQYIQLDDAKSVTKVEGWHVTVHTPAFPETQESANTTNTLEKCILSNSWTGVGTHYL